MIFLNPFNIDFIEEYKSLDNLLSEIYGSEKGITEYINMMREKDYGCDFIPEWDSELYSLCHFRHIRNRLSHEAGAFDKDICSEKDVEQLRLFGKKILSGTDPLSELRKGNPVIVTRTVHRKKQNKYFFSSEKFFLLIISVIFLASLFLLIAYFLFYY